MTPQKAIAQPGMLERIWRLAARIQGRCPMPGRDADDVAQQIALGVLRRAHSFDPARATAEAFVITAARSAAADILRADRRAKRDPRRVQPLSDAPTNTLVQVPGTDAASDDRHARVERAISKMEACDAEVARDLERFGAPGARKRLGSSRPQWDQARKRIRLTLEAENLGDSVTKPRRRAGDGVSH